MNPSENSPEPLPPATDLNTLVATDSFSAISADERQWAMLAHLSALLGYLMTSGWAGCSGGFIGPFIVWIIKKDTMPFVDQQGKEALNFSLTICLALGALFGFGIMYGIVTFGLGFLLALLAMGVVLLYALVFTIIASVKAYEGVAYRYPISLRLIK
jgi:uncharacterized protein